MKKRGNRKAQAAIFLIAAVVIVLAGVLFFAYQNRKDYPEVIEQAMPVKTFVESCLKTAAEDGMRRIGLSGGYIEVPVDVVNSPKAYFSTFKSGFKVPYWYHDGTSRVPSLDAISAQLKKFVENEVKSCTNNFADFSQFEIEEKSKPVASVSFNENDVLIKLDYELDVKSGDFSTGLSSFGQSLPIRFKRIYEMASLIMDRQVKDKFFERKTIDLISLTKDIPTTDIDVSCRTKTWQLQNIKSRLTRLLQVNIPYVRIKGTNYNPNLYVPTPNDPNIYSRSYYQYHYVWDIDKESEKKFDDFKVSFSYDSWPMYLYARPSENGVLKSNVQKGTKMASFMCLQIWHFTYDISFPVLATIHDQSSDGTQYQFSFPFKVEIDRNIASRAQIASSFNEIVPQINSDEYCNDVQNEITIYTIDNSTGSDISGVNLTFSCGRHYCDMGTSDWISLGAASGVTKRLPYCVNAVIRGQKEGYLETVSFAQTDVDGRSYLFFMNPLAEVRNFKVIKHPLSNPSATDEFAENEKAAIIIKGWNNGFESFASYPNDGEQKLQIPIGKQEIYQVSIYVTDEENIVAGYEGNWSTSKDAINDFSEIIFHTISQNTGTEEEKAMFIANLEEHSKKVPKPEIR